MTDIKALGDWRNNAEMIADVAKLYIKPTDEVYDCTYGLGNFWADFKPVHFTGSDLDVDRSPMGSIDYEDLPWEDDSFDVVVFDPPYRLSGTPNRGGPASSDPAYGVDRYVSFADRYSNIQNGLEECLRVSRRLVLFKCQDQVSGGRVRWMTYDFVEFARSKGAGLVDSFLLTGQRAQPGGRRQLHARRNYSTLLVFGV